MNIQTIWICASPQVRRCATYSQLCHSLNRTDFDVEIAIPFSGLWSIEILRNIPEDFGLLRRRHFSFSVAEAGLLQLEKRNGAFHA